MEGTTDTDPSEHSALTMHLDYGHLKLESPAWPVLDVTLDGTTDTGTDPSERLALASHLDYGPLNLESPARPVVDVALDSRPMEGIITEDLSGSKPLEHSVSDMDVENNILEVHDEPLFGSDRGWSGLQFTDAMR